MIKIDPEKLCEFCVSTLEVNPSRCEGSRCTEAYDSYIESIGIEDSDRATCFGELHIGDTIYYLSSANELRTLTIVAKAESLRDGIPKVYFTVKSQELNHYLDVRAQRTASIFIHKKDAIAAYTALITRTIQKMTEHLILFSK